MKKLSLFLILLTALVVSACESFPGEYYVRYDITYPFYNKDRDINLRYTIRTESDLETIKGSQKVTRTIGPVSKGFRAHVEMLYGDPIYSTIMVSVAEGEGSFVVCAIGSEKVDYRVGDPHKQYRGDI